MNKEFVSTDNRLIVGEEINKVRDGDNFFAFSVNRTGLVIRRENNKFLIDAKNSIFVYDYDFELFIRIMSPLLNADLFWFYDVINKEIWDKFFVILNKFYNSNNLEEATDILNQIKPNNKLQFLFYFVKDMNIGVLFNSKEEYRGIYENFKRWVYLQIESNKQIYFWGSWGN